MNNYITPLTISSYRVDCRKNLKPYAFMAAAQEAANVNATAIGCGYAHLFEQNVTWVLSRMRVEYLRQPRFMQDTVLETWQKGMKGPFSLRDFEIRDAATDEILVRCTTSWLLIDLGSRELVRMDKLIGDILKSTAVPKDAIPTPCGKIKSSPDTALCCSHRVMFSDIDYNLHVNNAKYMEWALDALDFAFVSTHDIVSYDITFNHEVHQGDTVDIYVSAPAPLTRYIEGRYGGKISFQTIVNFR